MKKLLAVLCVFATLFTLAACKNKEKELTPEESLASLKAEQSKNYAEYEKNVAASIKHEEDIIAEKQDTLDNLGKTEKGKKIVFLSDGQHVGMKEGYEVIKFGSDGKFESWLQYIYYPSTEAFDRAISDIKSEGNYAYETSDASLRVIVYRMANEKMIKDFKTLSYDQLYTNVKSFGYSIVE